MLVDVNFFVFNLMKVEQEEDFVSLQFHEVQEKSSPSLDPTGGNIPSE